MLWVNTSAIWIDPKHERIFTLLVERTVHCKLAHTWRHHRHHKNMPEDLGCQEDVSDPIF